MIDPHAPTSLACCGLLALAALSCSPAPPEPLRPASGASVLLVTLDTTRADRLGCYGSDRGLTPNLDRLAERAHLFEQAIAQASVTPVSHASILTGLDPYRHGLRVMHGVNENRLAEERVTLAELLRDAGYATGGFISAFPVAERFGLHQGYETFDESFLEGQQQELVSPAGIVNSGQVQRRSDATTDLALAWLERQTDRPFHLWVHYFDPHDPYVVPPGLTPVREETSPEHLRELYDEDVRFMDLQLGRLLSALDESGRADSTLVVVVADHGEGLGDHDWWTHGVLYQEQVRVPLLIHAPGQTRGQRIPDLVRTIDILPTVAELVELQDAVPPRLDGVSLRPLLEGQPLESKLVAYTDSVNLLTYGLVPGITDRKNDMLFGVVEWPWKFVLHLYEPQNSELYDLASDPHELDNRIDAREDLARRLTGRLRERRFLPELPFPPSGTSPQDIERLRALGYVE